MKAPSYRGLQPRSDEATAAAKGASRKSGTKPELLLRKALWHRGFRYRVSPKWLPGRPDIVLTKQRVAIFVDGDFWHGRNLPWRLERLGHGHNADYWTQKIKSNVHRDQLVSQELQQSGWQVLRFWETDVKTDPEALAERIVHDMVTKR